MKGFIKRALTLACGSVVLATAGGCYSCSDFIDPCWPERYNAAAKQEVNEASAPQIRNGHVLDQTIWNYYFEAGTDRLTYGAMDHLDYLVRRRPCPDPQLYLQTAHDIPYDPNAPEKFAEARCDLDTRRIGAIQKYLTAQTAGRHIEFQVAVHDPSDPGISAVPAGLSIQRMYNGTQGVLTTVGGGASGGAGASGSGGSSGGGGAGR